MVGSGEYSAVPDKPFVPYVPGSDPEVEVKEGVIIDSPVAIRGKVVISEGAHIGFGSMLIADNGGELLIGKHTEIGPHNIIRASVKGVKIGDGVHTGSFCEINYHNSEGMPASGEVEIGEGTSIGGYCFIGNNVRLGKKNHIGPNTRLEYFLTLGEHNRLTGCFLGVNPQDRVFYSELDELGEESQSEGAPEEALRETLGVQHADPTYTVIGNNNIIREGVRIARGTGKTQKRTTYIGNNNFIMDNTHIAHDCTIGSDITITTGSKLAGHVHIDDFANLAGSVKVVPFVHIGLCAYVTGNTGVADDIPPYFIAREDGKRAQLTTVPNYAGIRRMLQTTRKAKGEHFDEQECKRLEETLLRMKSHVESGNLYDAIRLQQLLQEDQSPEMQLWVRFLQESAARRANAAPKFKRGLETF